MSVRKKWRVRVLPTFTERSAASEAEAYRIVQRHREDFRLGVTRVTGLVVLVDERQGAGWQTFDRIRFAGEASSLTPGEGGVSGEVEVACPCCSGNDEGQYDELCDTCLSAAMAGQHPHGCDREETNR